MSDVEPYPEDPARRAALTKVSEMAISAVPGVGGPLQIAFTEAVGRALAERRVAWSNGLLAKVNDLEHRLADLERLAAGDPGAFVIDEVVAALTHSGEQWPPAPPPAFPSGSAGEPPAAGTGSEPATSAAEDGDADGKADKEPPVSDAYADPGQRGRTLRRLDRWRSEDRSRVARELRRSFGYGPREFEARIREHSDNPEWCRFWAQQHAEWCAHDRQNRARRRAAAANASQGGDFSAWPTV